jgi:hypothetical protein
MDTRQQPRFETDQEVTVTLLGNAPFVVSGRVVNFSGKGICVRSPRALPPGAPLKIEFSDTLLLGEVVYCRGNDETYDVGITVEQALYHTRDLAALAQTLLDGGNRSCEPALHSSRNRRQ